MKKSMFQVEKESKNIQGIFLFVLEIINDALPVKSTEECIVFNDPNAECPMLITNETPLKLRINVEVESRWNQVIYQISHELMHYAFRQGRDNRDERLDWFEETICESFSLYIMFISMTDWKLCELSKENRGYFKNIGSYFNKERNKEGDKISRCSTLECLREVNDKAGEHREWRYNIRNQVFELFKKCPSSIKEVLKYPRYVQNNQLTIDFDKWEGDSKRPEFIRELAKIQPEVS
jgi:hypothetical protein